MYTTDENVYSLTPEHLNQTIEATKRELLEHETLIKNGSRDFDLLEEYYDLQEDLERLTQLF